MKKIIGITGLVLASVPVLMVTAWGLLLFGFATSEYGFFGTTHDPDYVSGILAIIVCLVVSAVPIAGYITFLLEKKIPAAILLVFFMVGNTSLIGESPLIFEQAGALPYLIPILLVLNTICALVAFIYSVKEL